MEFGSDPRSGCGSSVASTLLVCWARPTHWCLGHNNYVVFFAWPSTVELCWTHVIYVFHDLRWSVFSIFIITSWRKRTSYSTPCWMWVLWAAMLVAWHLFHAADMSHVQWRKALQISCILVISRFTTLLGCWRCSFLFACGIGSLEPNAIPKIHPEEWQTENPKNKKRETPQNKRNIVICTTHTAQAACTWPFAARCVKCAGKKRARTKQYRIKAQTQTFVQLGAGAQIKESKTNATEPLCLAAKTNQCSQLQMSSGMDPPPERGMLRCCVRPKGQSICETSILDDVFRMRPKNGASPSPTQSKCWVSTFGDWAWETGRTLHRLRYRTCY